MNIYRKYISKYFVPFTCAVLCVTGEAVCDLLCPSFMARIIDEGIEQNSLAAVYRWGSFMLLATACGALFALARNIISTTVSQDFGAGLRYDLFSHILHFPVESADRIEPGSLITRLTNDVSQAVNFVSGMMRIFLKAPLTCIGSMVLASMLNLRLSLIIYAVIASVALLLYVSMRLSYPRYAQLQKAMDTLNTRVEEYLMGIRLVKAFGTCQSETEKFSVSNTELLQKNIHAQIVITLFSPLLTLVAGVGTVLVLYSGSMMYAAGTVGPGEISAFVVYMAQILSSLLMITNIFNHFVRMKASGRRIAEVLTEPVEGTGQTKVLGPSGSGAPSHPLSVEFRHITFSYPEGSGRAALEDISFTVPAGKSLAVIGPTGSGKSTAVWLLLRMYTADSGTILLGGKDTAAMDVAEVRQSIALVPQQASLFSGTVRSNVAWGKTDAADSAVYRALETSCADFIPHDASGLAETTGAGGVNFSGGQKQRLSIARALVKDAPVLLLDDATSALDALTEAKIRAALFSGSRNSTVIFITQRCSTAMAADRILVLEDGRCCGYGTHAQLIKTCSVYRGIYDSQLGGYTNGRK